MTTDPGELIARYLAAHPLPDDAQDGMTTEELAEHLGHLHPEGERQ